MFQYQHDQPGVHELMKELRAVMNEYEDRVMVGETDDIAFYGDGTDELHLNFNFPLMHTQRLTPQHVIENQNNRLSHLPEGAWPCNTLGNHDSPRMLNYFGDGKNNKAIARVNLMLLLTLKGTPFLYNGEEFGMSDIKITDLKDFVDPVGYFYYRLEKVVMGSDDATALQEAALRSRDRGRSPLQWSAEANAGFCPAGVKPWLPVNPDYAKGVNYADEVGRENSIWNYYRNILAFRKSTPALILGDQKFRKAANENLLAYTREFENEKCLILLNMGSERLEIDLKAYQFVRYTKVFATDSMKVQINNGKVELSGFSGEILAA